MGQHVEQHRTAQHCVGSANGRVEDNVGAQQKLKEGGRRGEHESGEPGGWVGGRQLLPNKHACNITMQLY